MAAEVSEKSGNIGFDANTGEYTDMLTAGILDPTKVSKQALQNAASLAGLLLMTETIVTEVKTDEDEDAPVPEGVVR